MSLMRNLGALWTLLALCLLPALEAPAQADTRKPPPSGWVNTTGGEVATGIESRGINSGSKRPSSAPLRQAPSCRTVTGESVACSAFGGRWSNQKNCYSRPKQPQPPKSDPAWQGNSSGVIMECARGDMYGWSISWDWWQATSEPAELPDPAVLAQRAIDTMSLRAITMGIFPKSVSDDPDALGYVGWNTWLWADSPSDETWGPITASASAGGYTVTATAEVDRVVWDMGNSDTVSCGKGTPWRPRYTNNEPSPDCGYIYEQPGRYTITATSYWSVHWSGIGETGVIPLELSDTRDLVVAEVQVVNTTGR